MCDDNDYDYDYDWDMDSNAEIDSAIKWIEWLSNVKDPGPALIAAKVHGSALLKAYRAMYSQLSAYNDGRP